MSGTSADGIDAALVEMNDDGCHFHAGTHRDYTDCIRQAALALNHNSTTTVEQLCTLEQQISYSTAETIQQLLGESGITNRQVRACGCHGQTIIHRPDADLPFTKQLLDPSQVAYRTGIDTVADFRRADIAAGGNGAPLVPAFHAFVFAPSQCKVVLNLGGIANISILRPGQISGFDTGPANTLLDAWINHRLGQLFDNGGNWAASGSVDSGLLHRLLQDPFFNLTPPKSTGPDYFNLDWLQARLNTTNHPESTQATLTELTAVSAANAIKQHAPEAEQVLVCGGGAHNDFLMQRIGAQLAPIAVRTTDTMGVNGTYCEAMAFAWLAFRHLRREPGNLAAVTGARNELVLGGLYPAPVATDAES